jgi:hypothetical protein
MIIMTTGNKERRGMAGYCPTLGNFHGTIDSMMILLYKYSPSLRLPLRLFVSTAT